MRTVTILFTLYLVTTTATVNEEVPIINLDNAVESLNVSTNNNTVHRRVGNPIVYPKDFLPLLTLIDKDNDTSEFWHATEILNLIRNIEEDIDYEKCDESKDEMPVLHFPPIRTISPICRNTIDRQLCPQCPIYSNITECELFRDSCIERRVHPSEYRTYCDDKYGKWRTMFMAANYSECRCCDECVFYRELDQSCVEDEYIFEIEEFLPVTTIDFRAGCNPYWGHPQQEKKALKCETILRRCVPVTNTLLTKETMNIRRSHRFEPPTNASQCPASCHEYYCAMDTMRENDCAPGAFLPDKTMCNCCGRCSSYQQLDENCTIDMVEDDFLESGCDDGLVCHEGRCQDMHTLETGISRRMNRDEVPYEPCKHEMKNFKKKYGKDGHLHNEAPQCSPLWLYAPIQCRHFFCYCALEDGTFIDGIEVPRANVSNMNCDCAREKSRTDSDLECDKYGNYKEVTFIQHIDKWNVTNAGNVLVYRAQPTRNKSLLKRRRRTTRRGSYRLTTWRRGRRRWGRGTSRINRSYLPIILLSLSVSLVAYILCLTTVG